MDSVELEDAAPDLKDKDVSSHEEDSRELEVETDTGDAPIAPSSELEGETTGNATRALPSEVKGETTGADPSALPSELPSEPSAKDLDLQDDIREASQILFYTSKSGSVSRDTMLKQIGLVRGLMGFTE